MEERIKEGLELIPLSQHLLRGTAHNMYPIMKKDGLRSESVQCAKLLGGSSDAHLCAWIVMWDFVWPHASGIITQHKTGTFCLSLSANDNF